MRPYFRFGAFAELAKDRAGLVRFAIRHARREGWIGRDSHISLIGDHPNDVRAAKANGIRAIAVATGLIAIRRAAIALTGHCRARSPVAYAGDAVLMEAQSLAVKRAEVEFHNFASLGEPERAIAHYAEQNIRRGAVIRNHLRFIGEMTPFLEIGSNVGHTSYMLANEFGASGFALDISADSLRYGAALQDRWRLSRSPIRVAGDAVNLPFADGSLRFVMAFQMLSQFMNMESVFLEVKRVLAPGGTFLFAEEPLKRLLSLRLYRCPYYNTMKPWERKLVRLGAARISGARRDRRASGGELRYPPESHHGAERLAPSD